jgi:triphosphoribosyl-dephospho-CoA synthetase
MRYTIVDIETRIDKHLVRAIYFPHTEIPEEDAYMHARRLLEEQGNDFFPLSFHIPISIAIGQVNEERVLTTVETLNEDQYSEEGLVRNFWQRFERFNGTLMGATLTYLYWNCRPSSTAARRRVILVARHGIATSKRDTTTSTIFSPTMACIAYAAGLTS